MNNNEEVKNENNEPLNTDEVDYNFDFSNQVNNEENSSGVTGASEVLDADVVPEVTQAEQVLDMPQPGSAPEMVQPEPEQAPEMVQPEPEQAPEMVQPEPEQAPEMVQPEPVQAPEMVQPEPVQTPEMVQPEPVQTPEMVRQEPNLVDVSVPVDTDSIKTIFTNSEENVLSNNTANSSDIKSAKSGKKTVIFGVILLIIIAGFIIALPFIAGL